MEPLAPVKSAKIKRWLPYWAVFQADFRQTLHSWVYRFWVLLSVLAAVGYLLYRFGISHEAGIVQPASKLISDLLRWSVLGSVALIIALTGGSISSERGIMADSDPESEYRESCLKLQAMLSILAGSPGS